MPTPPLPGTDTSAPVRTWRALADRIDPAITREPDWPAFAAAIARASAAGYEVDEHLPRLAQEATLTGQHRARELHYRLISEVPAAATSPAQQTTAATAAATDDAAQARLHRSQNASSGAAGSGDSGPPDVQRPDEIQRPDERWRPLADRIEPQLAISPGWGGLVATIEQAAREGYDVETNLPRLAAEAPLPDNAPALELQYRLLAEVDLDIPEATARTPYQQRGPRREAPPTSPQVGRDRPAGPRR